MCGTSVEWCRNLFGANSNMEKKRKNQKRAAACETKALTARVWNSSQFSFTGA